VRHADYELRVVLWCDQESQPDGGAAPPCLPIPHLPPIAVSMSQRLVDHCVSASHVSQRRAAARSSRAASPSASRTCPSTLW